MGENPHGEPPVMFVPYVRPLGLPPGMFNEAITVNAPERLSGHHRRRSGARAHSGVDAGAHRIANTCSGLVHSLAGLWAPRPPSYHLPPRRGDDL